MNDKEDMLVEWAARVFVAAVLLSMVWALSSCSYRYIPVESVRHDSGFYSKMVKDSIFVRDSLFVREKGDTVFVDKFKYIYKTHVKTDTCFITRRDSVPYPVEKPLSRWEKAKMDTGGYLIVVIVGYVAYRIIRWIVKRTRKRN